MYQLTEDQELLLQTVNEFGAQRLAPTVLQRDAANEFDESLVKELLDLGLQGICFPEEYGGAGASYVDYILALRDICKYDDGIGITYSASVSLGASPIDVFGTPEQKEKYLRPVAEGKTLAAFALTEPNAGTDAASQLTVAEKVGDEYIINGSKLFITNAGPADVYVIFAMTDKSQGTKGISAFIIEKGMPGFTFGPEEHKMGIHTSITRELIFKDLHVPAANLLGQEGKGFKIAMHTLDGGRIGVAAQATGIAQAALQHAVEYTKQREQFGRAIAKFQHTQFKLAEMATKVEAANLMLLNAANDKAAGRPYTVSAAMAKMFCSDVAMEVATDAVQLFGGYGYSEDYPVARLFRNAKITQIYEGTNEVQKMVVSGAVLR